MASGLSFYCFQLVALMLFAVPDAAQTGTSARQVPGAQGISEAARITRRVMGQGISGQRVGRQQIPGAARITGGGPATLSFEQAIQLVGIAAVTTMLARGAQTHQAVMVSHLTPYDPVFQQRMKQITAAFAARVDPLTAMHQAYGSIYNQLVAQATLLAYIRYFSPALISLFAVCPLSASFQKS